MVTNYRLRFKGLRDTTPVVENQTEKTLKNNMETGTIQWVAGIRACFGIYIGIPDFRKVSFDRLRSHEYGVEFRV